MPKNLQYLFGLNLEAEKSMILVRRKKGRKKKTTFENDNDGAIRESVSKLNIIISYDDANNAS